MAGGTDAGAGTRRWAVCLLVALLAGCAREDAAPTLATVDAPTGGGWAECPPRVSRGLAVGFRADATNETRGLPTGVHRLDERSFLFVWGSFHETLREDRVTRVNAVDVATDGEGVVHVCTRVDLATPTTVDEEPRTYGVGVLLAATDALPRAPVRVVVNWVAGCPCDPLPRGNETAIFPEATLRVS